METDHEELHRELESTGDELEERRDKLKEDTDEAQQDVQTKASDQRTPGLQNEQEDVIGGKDAVDEAQAEDDEADSGGGSEVGGYEEDED